MKKFLQLDNLPGLPLDNVHAAMYEYIQEMHKDECEQTCLALLAEIEQRYLLCQALSHIQDTMAKGYSSKQLQHYDEFVSCLRQLLTEEIDDIDWDSESLISDIIEKLLQKYEDLKSVVTISKDIRKQLEHIPIINKRDLISHTQPADVFLAATPKSRVAKLSLHIYVVNRLMKLLQRSPFSSSKLVYNDNQLIGYGLQSKEIYGLYSFPVFLHILQQAVVLRHKDITDDIARTIVEAGEKQIGLKYSRRQLVETFWNRLSHEKVLQVAIGSVPIPKEQAEEEVKLELEPMLCSSIIVAFYLAAGLEINVKPDNYDNVWPKDFLLSDSFEPVVRLDVK